MRKVILITGASSGIGEATAKQLLSEGHVVYCGARRVEKMAGLKDLGAHVLALDVTDNAAIESAVNQIINEQGRMDVLFNNAGFGLDGSVEETTIDDARYQFEVNLFGLARLTQLVIPHMRKQGSGMILNTSSIGGKIYVPLGAWYHATKHALEGWSDCLRLELKQFGIKVVIIEPGAIKTEFSEVMMEPLVKRSGHGPYKNLVNNFSSKLKELNEKGGGSPPSVIADVVSKAINAKEPKTRYVAGQFAGQMLFMRRWLSDKQFDKMMMNWIK